MKYRDTILNSILKLSIVSLYFIILLMFLLFPIFAFSSPASVKEKSDKNYYSLSKLKTMTPREGAVYVTEGYVIMKYDCPPCPENAVCAPCPPDYIVISPKKKLIEYPDQVGPHDMLVILAANIDFKVGKQYRFTLQLSHQATWWKDWSNLEVVDAQVINMKKTK